MLSINNLSYFIGERPIYKDASVHIKPKDKIGLIGPNGSGKTTLLRLITGEYQPGEGTVSKSKDCSIGFLNQDLLSYASDDTILHVTMQAFEEALSVQEKIEKVLEKMETDYEEKLIAQLTKLQEKFESLEGYTLQSKAEELLEGIGFSTEDLKRPLNDFSGGWRMRVMLAKLLLEKPSLLLMDEPTNHLDLPSIEWIENYLRTYDGAFIVVSHDRRFINNTVSSIAEVSNCQINLYNGNYQFYLEEKALREDIQRNAFINQQQKIKQTERFINRFRAKSTKARQVQSKIKSLQRIDLVEDVIDNQAKVNFKFTFTRKSGRHVINLDNISKAYEDIVLFKNASARIERGDKIALIGANGKGKSTLLRIIAKTEPHEGKTEQGYNVITTFYAQHQLEALNLKNKILEELAQTGSGKTELELRNLLGCFLFSDDDVFKKIKVLSGGEKSRVALAKTLLSEANFLLLDEPTNHLDIQSENILIQALQQYQGTFIVVSHNRHFISQVANKIWYFEHKQIKEYPGNYEEYEYWKNNVKEVALRHEIEVVKVKKAKKAKPISGDRIINKIKKDIELIENKISGLEKDLANLDNEMVKPEIYGDHEKLQVINIKYGQNQSKLNKLNEEWEKLMLQLETQND